MSGNDGANVASYPAARTQGHDRLMRASDHDRDLATQVLRDAFTEGRLDISEFLKRVDTACSAKTWGELADLTADLPADWTRSLKAPAACTCDEHAEMRYEPRHPFAPMWWVAVAWLVVAAIAHAAAAIPLVLLSLYVLGVACRGNTAPGVRTRPSRASGRAAGSARPPGQS